MNKADLSRQLAETSKIPLQRAEFAIDTIFQTIANAVANGSRVEIRGFGVFSSKDYPGFMGRNPKTGEAVPVAPKRTPVFKPGKDISDKINGISRKKSEESKETAND